VRPYLEKPFIKTAGVVAQGDGPEFKPQYCKKKKKKVGMGWQSGSSGRAPA
jgi:hypothetical protein